MTDPASKIAGAFRDLSSADLALRVHAVEDLAHFSHQIVEEVLAEFAKPGPARFLIFERLGRFGSLVVEPLEQLLPRSEDEELRVLTAAALLCLGSGTGVDVLLDAVRPDHPQVCLAVHALADSGINDAAARIEAALRECDLADTDVVGCLVDGLRRLGGPLPDDVRARLVTVEPGWLRDSLLSDLTAERGVRMGPPRYSASLIKPVRPPEVEGEIGEWHALWQLATNRPVSEGLLRRAEAEISAAAGIEVRLQKTAGSRVRLETITAVHPLEAEAWPVIDSMLLALDRLIGLATINDSPREWWRPFR